MDLLNKARQNRIKALAELEARERNLFAANTDRPDRPAPFKPLDIAPMAEAA